MRITQSLAVIYCTGDSNKENTCQSVITFKSCGFKNLMQSFASKCREVKGAEKWGKNGGKEVAYCAGVESGHLRDALA